MGLSMQCQGDGTLELLVKNVDKREPAAGEMECGVK
jgi:hypothetical protein